MFYTGLFLLLVIHTIFSFSNSKILKVVIPVMTFILLIVFFYESEKAPYCLKINGNTYNYDNYNELQKEKKELITKKEEFVVEINGCDTMSKTEYRYICLLFVLEIVEIYAVNKMKERRKY